MARRTRPARREAARARAILSRQIGDALGALRGARGPSDAAVHAARKKLKQARAGVRLLRIAAGAGISRQVNAMLRDAARPLSRMRDARVMLDATQSLIETEKNAGMRAALARLQRALRSEMRQARDQLSASAPGLRQVLRPLETAQSKTAQLQVENANASGLRDGMKLIYRKGRKAMRACEAARSDDKLHEARKQVKYLSAALKYFVEIGGADTTKLTQRADSIADALGDDHDLAVLQGRVAALSDRSGHVDAGLATRLQRRRTRLQRQALKDARRLYRKTPAVFVARL